MKITLGSGDPLRSPADLLAVPLFDSDLDAKAPGKLVAALDKKLGGLLLEAARDEEFTAKAESTLMLHTHGKLRARRLLLIGLGSRQKFTSEALRLAAGKAVKTAQRVSATGLALALLEADELEASVRAVAEGALLGAYTFDRYKSKGDKAKKMPELREVTVLLPGSRVRSRALEQALALGTDVAESTNWARDLVNEPANTLTPGTLADAARKLAREEGLAIEVLGREQIKRLRMGMFLAVAQASAEPPVLIHLSYTPKGAGAKKKPLALIGKAITFDSGGLSLKPTDSMHDMKTDMAGSAAVLGAMKAIARLAPPFPVHAFMGACENMPGGRAYKIGDVLTSRKGKTVEITNTDAEGRLVLGDVLAWAAELGPSAMIDLATLTGACVVALGMQMAGVFGADDAIVGEVLESSKAAGEEMWRLPLHDAQRDAIKSDIADLKNTGERWGGAISAAMFLKEFVGDVPWVHVDIAGPASTTKERGYQGKGATGVGVRTLVELVRRRAG